MRKNRAFIPLVILLFAGVTLAVRAQDAPGRTAKVKVVAEQANLREKPDIGSAIVQMIPEGTVLEADRKDGEWYLVRYTLEDGGVIAGYIHESLVTVVAEGQAEADRQRIEPNPSVKPAAVARQRIEGGAGRASSGIELSLSAGGSSVSARDLNHGAQGLADANAALLGIPAEGTVDALRVTYGGGVAIMYRTGRWLALGLGIEYLRGANAGAVRYSEGEYEETLKTRPGVRVVPVKVMARFTPGAGFYIQGAVGLYFGKASYLYRFDRPGSWEQWRGRATALGLGTEVALGGDWPVGPRTSFFAEAGFRLARIGDFKGEDQYLNSLEASQTEKGALYYFLKQGVDSRAYPLLFVRQSRPGEAGVVDARKAEINLTGTALRAGLRFRF